MSYFNKLFKYINTESVDLEEEDDGIGYNSPNVFKDEDEDEEPDVFKESFNSIQEKLNSLLEVSYKDFRQDDTKTVKEKLNNSIHEINKGLAHAERLIGHAIKLKTEVGANQTIFLKETFRKFTKIGERMNRLQSKIREFSK